MKDFFTKGYWLPVLVIVLSSFFVGWQVGLSQNHGIFQVTGVENMDSPEELSVDFSPFWRAWSVIESKHVVGGEREKVSDQEKIWGAIKGLVNSLDDPHTIFLPPEEVIEFESDLSGQFQGVGMEVGIRDEVLTVVAPLKNTPAYRAGILPRDKILEIDGVSTRDMNIEEAVRLIRGERGTEVEFVIFREGREDLLEVSVVRDVIEMPVLDTEVLEGEIFLITLYGFPLNTSEHFERAMREYSNSGLSKMILDLRGNPGGFLQPSIEIASWFLPTGKVVVNEDYNGNRKNMVHRSRGYGDWRSEGDDLVVLINGGSASASEILAGALREHLGVPLVGTTTFGKGTVQELVNVTADTKIKITIAEWLTPEGKSFSDVGIAPDYEVERTLEDFEESRDPQLEKALELLR